MTQPSNEEPRVVRFRGWISCRRDGEGPLGLILVGHTSQHRRDEAVQIAFSCPAPADIPDALEDARVEFLGDNQYRLTSGGKSWALQGAAHVHREVAGAFYKALPPRPVPLRKRLFWRVMLALAANPLGRKLLLRGR
ncbi:MAG: hypothetical protein WDO56_24045 [Gammaproteobacteria bacterium]